ncbi:MAG: hypothetical protein K2Z25_25740 [Beijerinckiaceae bacterium]|nr:hypothetical protein [Beijerinckiaceae bacterium]
MQGGPSHEAGDAAWTSLGSGEAAALHGERGDVVDAGLFKLDGVAERAGFDLAAGNERVDHFEARDGADGSDGAAEWRNGTTNGSSRRAEIGEIGEPVPEIGHEREGVDLAAGNDRADCHDAQMVRRDGEADATEAGESAMLEHDGGDRPAADEAAPPESAEDPHDRVWRAFEQRQAELAEENQQGWEATSEERTAFWQRAEREMAEHRAFPAPYEREEREKQDGTYLRPEQRDVWRKMNDGFDDMVNDPFFKDPGRQAWYARSIEAYEEFNDLVFNSHRKRRY